MTELDRYLREGWITWHQHYAGIRFCSDARAAARHLHRRRNHPLAGSDPAERAAAARVELAAHILGPHRHVLLAVARGMGASTWAEQAGLPHVEGMARLRAALDALVRLEARHGG